MDKEPVPGLGSPKSKGWLEDNGPDLLDAFFPDLFDLACRGYDHLAVQRRALMGSRTFNAWRMRVAVWCTWIVFVAVLFWFVSTALGEFRVWQHLGNLPYMTVTALLPILILAMLLHQLRRPRRKGWVEVPVERHFLARVFLVIAISFMALQSGIAELVLDGLSYTMGGRARGHLLPTGPSTWSIPAIFFMVLLVAYGLYCVRFLVKRVFVYHPYIRLLEVKRFAIAPWDFLMRYAGLHFFSIFVPDWIPRFGARGEGYADTVRRFGDDVAGYFAVGLFAILTVSCLVEIGDFAAAFQQTAEMEPALAMGGEVPEEA